jgi:hypothetical protein
MRRNEHGCLNADCEYGGGMSKKNGGRRVGWPGIDNADLWRPLITLTATRR